MKINEMTNGLIRLFLVCLSAYGLSVRAQNQDLTTWTFDTGSNTNWNNNNWYITSDAFHAVLNYTNPPPANAKPRLEIFQRGLAKYGQTNYFEFTLTIRGGGGCFFQLKRAENGADGGAWGNCSLWCASVNNNLLGFSIYNSNDVVTASLPNFTDNNLLNDSHRILIKEYMSTQTNGFYTIYIDGTNQGTLYGATCDGTNGCIAKCGDYSGSTTDNEHWVGSCTISNMNFTADGINLASEYEIENVHSGEAMVPGSNGVTNNTPIIQYPYSDTANFHWSFLATSNGYYQVVSANSGKDAVVYWASTTNNAPIKLADFGSAKNDQWKPVQNPADGSYTFYNLKSGLVLENPNSGSPGTDLVQYSGNGADYQHWLLIPQ